jgi:hypothetical protein
MSTTVRVNRVPASAVVKAETVSVRAVEGQALLWAALLAEADDEKKRDGCRHANKGF